MSKRTKTSQVTSTASSDPGLPQYTHDDQPPRYDQALKAVTALDGTVTVRPLEKQDFETRSLASTTHSNFIISSTLLPNTSFIPARTLIIQAKGLRALRWPAPSTELEIGIFSPEGDTVYKSRRPRVCKGDCVLSSANGEELVATDYFFGPGRDPVIREVTPTTSTLPVLSIDPSSITRNLDFVHVPSGAHFGWSYSSVRAAEGGHAQGLALRTFDADARRSEKRKTGKIVAQLIRSKVDRTPGTKKTFAGNGGKLVIAHDADQHLSEELIVASCLMMLKREIDSRRFAQFAFVMGGVFLICSPCIAAIAGLATLGRHSYIQKKAEKDKKYMP